MTESAVSQSSKAKNFYHPKITLSKRSAACGELVESIEWACPELVEWASLVRLRAPLATARLKKKEEQREKELGISGADQ